MPGRRPRGGSTESQTVPAPAGAGRRHVVSQIPAQGLRWALIGCAIGVAGAFALGRILISKVWWIKAEMLLGVIALPACYVPARHATRIDPAEALRAD